MWFNCKENVKHILQDCGKRVLFLFFSTVYYIFFFFLANKEWITMNKSIGGKLVPGIFFLFFFGHQYSSCITSRCPFFALKRFFFLFLHDVFPPYLRGKDFVLRFSGGFFLKERIENAFYFSHFNPPFQKCRIKNRDQKVKYDTGKKKMTRKKPELSAL